MVSAVIVLRTLNTAELTDSVTYPDIGYACQLPTLGGNANSGAPRPEAAQLISADLAAGQMNGYTYQIFNCRTTLVNGRKVYTGYQITAVPLTDSQAGNRGFCTDEGMEIRYDPKGGTNCTEPLQQSFLGNRHRQEKLDQCRQLLGMAIPELPSDPPTVQDYRDRYETLTGTSLRQCPFRHRGHMIRVGEIETPQRPPAIKDTS